MTEQNANGKNRLPLTRRPLIGGGQGRKPVFASEVTGPSRASDLFFFALIFLLIAISFVLGVLTAAQALP
jgi:hypothetical protein